MGGRTVLMYFTIQTNVAMAVLCSIGALYMLIGKTIPNRWYIVKYVGTLSITVTGAVFCFVLAPTMGPLAWNRVNIFTHIIVPIASIIDFFISGIHSSIRKRDVFYVTLPPILYVFYASIGYICNWEFAPGQNYPYFFLNWGSPAGAFGFCKELPFMGCVWWILLLLSLLMLVGLLYLRILDGIKKVWATRKDKVLL